MTRDVETNRHLFVTDWHMPNFDFEASKLEPAGWTLSVSEMNRATPPHEELLNEMLERLSQCKRVDAVLFQLAPVNRIFIEQLPESCKLIQRVGIGMDNIDHKAAAERGIDIGNTPGYCIEEVCMHAMAMMIGLHRGIYELHDIIQQEQWADRPPRRIFNLSNLTLGIVGLGRIGSRVAKSMQHFVKRTLFADPAVFEIDGVDNIERVELQQLLQESDIVTLHCPLNETSHHLIDAEALSMMKPTAILVNTARGGVIDLDALNDAIDSKDIAACGLDVFVPEVLPPDSPLRNRPNVILTSHAAWYSEESSPTARGMAMDKILAKFS